MIWFKVISFSATMFFFLYVAIVAAKKDLKSYKMERDIKEFEKDMKRRLKND